MLLANMRVAGIISRAFPAQALLRCALHNSSKTICMRCIIITLSIETMASTPSAPRPTGAKERSLSCLLCAPVPALWCQLPCRGPCALSFHLHVYVFRSCTYRVVCIVCILAYACSCCFHLQVPPSPRSAQGWESTRQLLSCFPACHIVTRLCLD
jgi:hypothetical protein